MESILPYLMIAAMVITFAVLVAGVIAMLRGGAFNARHGNRLMRFRVAAQFGAIVALGLLFLFGRG